MDDSPRPEAAATPVPSMLTGAAPPLVCRAGLPLNWMVERCAGSDGTSCVVLMPAGDDDEAPTFALYPSPDGIEMIACRWDHAQPVGRYPSVETAVDVIMLLTARPAPRRPASHAAMQGGAAEGWPRQRRAAPAAVGSPGGTQRKVASNAVG